jgi:hypothetical protein
MSNPTRAEKAVAIRAMCGAVAEYAKEGGRPPTDKFFDTFNAILADYAPLTEERACVLDDQREIIQHLLERVEDRLEDDPDDEDLTNELHFYKDWLAEIDAELEESDG